MALPRLVSSQYSGVIRLFHGLLTISELSAHKNCNRGQLQSLTHKTYCNNNPSIHFNFWIMLIFTDTFYIFHHVKHAKLIKLVCWKI